jgi:RHS repeat-associated protein
MYGAYRYGFNGKENDNEVKGSGNQQDYGERIYDTRVGRFLSTDPLTKSYPMLTPYQYASNSPVWMIDLDGLEGVKFSSVWNGRATLPQFIQNPDIYGTAVESAASLNRTINPGFSLWNYGVKLWTGTHDYDGNPIDARGRAGVVTDMGVETMQWMTGARFFKALPNASTPLEQQMAQNARATGTPPAKPAQSQAMAAEAKAPSSTTSKPSMQPTPVQQAQAKATGAPSLAPYNVGQGHHIPAKSAFRGDPIFDEFTALAIPKNDLLKFNLKHSTITGLQAKAYSAFAKTGQTLGWDEMSKIESGVLINAGLRPDISQSLVDKAIDALKKQGVNPTRIPWGGK